MEMQFPISEIFTSPQGEGRFTGTLMTFVRLAGCTVGKPYPKERYGYDQEMRGCAYGPAVLPIYTEKCTLYDGREFPCDTDYRVKHRLTISEIMQEIPRGIRRVCITGGEPLMHRTLPELVKSLQMSAYVVHIETSGTILLPNGVVPGWLTVSPKAGAVPAMIRSADEVKILVDDDFDVRSLTEDMKAHENLYIQPVNYEHTVNVDNLRRCMELQKQFPNFKISLQLHKILSDYLKETVR